MPTYTIQSINLLGSEEKRAIYSQAIPAELMTIFNINPDFYDKDGKDLLWLNADPGRSDVEMALYHEVGFPDPIFYGHIVDTINGQMHILLYILNNPNAPRFQIDRLSDGTPTKFGTACRNLEAELSAMQAGLAPGQIRSGLRLLGSAIRTFENFVSSLGQTYYFTEPLFYHNAVLFERYGFSYQQGRKLMDRIQVGFLPGGEFLTMLDGSTPFRSPGAGQSIRLRSWAIHDGILGMPFTNVTMYKQVGKSSTISTCQDCPW